MLKQSILSLSGSQSFLKASFVQIKLARSLCECLSGSGRCWRLKAVGYSWTTKLGELMLYESEEKGEWKNASKKAKATKERTARKQQLEGSSQDWICFSVKMTFFQTLRLPNPLSRRANNSSRSRFTVTLWSPLLPGKPNSPTNSHQLWIIRCCQASVLKKMSGGVAAEYQALQAETNE